MIDIARKKILAPTELAAGFFRREGGLFVIDRSADGVYALLNQAVGRRRPYPADPQRRVAPDAFATGHTSHFDKFAEPIGSHVTGRTDCDWWEVQNGIQSGAQRRIYRHASGGGRKTGLVA